MRLAKPSELASRVVNVEPASQRVAAVIARLVSPSHPVFAHRREVAKEMQKGREKRKQRNSSWRSWRGRVAQHFAAHSHAVITSYEQKRNLYGSCLPSACSSRTQERTITVISAVMVSDIRLVDEPFPTMLHLQR